MVFTSFYTVVDSLFITNFVSTTALAAINISFPIISLLTALGFMLSSGGMAWVSIKLGEGKKDKAIKDFSLIIYFGFFVIAVLVAIILPFIDPLIRMLGAKDAVLFKYTKDYLVLLLIMSPVFILQILFQNFLLVAGKGKLALVLTISSGLANIVFDYLFIVVLKMGIVGAALGTGIGYFVTAIYGCVFFLKNKNGLHLAKPSHDLKVITGTMGNGISEMVINLSVAVTTYFFNFLTLKYIGTDGVAAISIIMECQFLFSSIFYGFGMGSSPLIAFAWGAKKYKYTKNLLKLCFKINILFSVIMFGISFGGANIITRLFCKIDNPVYGITTYGLKLFSISFLFSGISEFTSSTFTSLGDGKRSGFIAFLRLFVFTVLFLTIFPVLFGITGIWLAVPAAETVMLLINIGFLYKLAKRLNVLHRNKQIGID